MKTFKDLKVGDIVYTQHYMVNEPIKAKVIKIRETPDGTIAFSTCDIEGILPKTKHFEAHGENTVAFNSLSEVLASASILELLKLQKLIIAGKIDYLDNALDETNRLIKRLTK